MPKIRTMFLGTPNFALSSLEACREHSELLGVVSQPDRPRGRRQKLSPSEVKAKALDWKLPVFCPEKMRSGDKDFDALIDFVQKEKPELFLVTAFGKILKSDFLKLPALGCFNLHASLLPKWRGAAPIQRSLEAGDKETGVSLQKMVLELDAGDVVFERSCEQGAEDNAQSMTQKLSALGGEVVAEFLKGLGDGQKIDATPQDPKLVSYAAKLSKEEGIWQPGWTAEQCFNRVRAFSHWPNVRTCVKINEQKIQKLPFLKITKTSLFSKPQESVRPGEIRLEGKKCLLGCADTSIEVLEVQAPGKSPVNAFVFLKNLVKDAASGAKISFSPD